MAHSRSRSILVAVLLAFPLVVILSWLVRGALIPAPPAKASPAAAPRGAEGREPSPLPGFPPPEADLPADRLHERVNGAEDYLRAQGCKRLLGWRLHDLSADLELFLFETPEGAGRVLGRDAGPTRTAGPGDEASADAQGVLFRRGAVYVRLVSDGASPREAGELLAKASQVDRGILAHMERWR